jgi:hypothetical protein
MLLIRVVLLWFLISVHIVGGAIVFRRFFPRELPWFGFIVPGLTLFIEHFFALASLVWLLPFTALGFLWAIIDSRVNWRGLRLPTALFLIAFTFTLGLRSLRPDILASRDGIQDFCMMSCFCVGEKVPPTLNWYPPFHLSQYYILGQYGISVLTRLFGLDLGTGFNVSSALLSAFDCLIVAGTAWRISRQKIWITVLAAVLVECAANGATAYLWIMTPNFDPNAATNILTQFDNPNDHNPLWKFLHQSGAYDRRELMAPGTWSWLGSFHSTCGGQFLTLLSVWALTETLRRRRANFPWICLVGAPILTLVTSTWAFPLEFLLLAGGLFCAWYYRFFPANIRFVLMAIGGITISLTPMLLEFLTTAAYPVQGWTNNSNRTQLAEFLIMWWPIYLPWAMLIFAWPRLQPAVKIILVVLPVVLTGAEVYTIGCRLDWTGKIWGYIYCAGWAVLFPALAMRRQIFFRLMTGVLLLSSFISLVAWGQWYWRSIDWNNQEVFHLEGKGPFRWDPLRGRLLQAMSQMKNQTVLTGTSGWSFCDSPMLAAFTGNRTYITWSTICDQIVCGTTYGEAYQREKEVNNLYAGKCPNPLLFLRTHDIAAVVIYPLDHISDQVVTSLKKQLSPYYEYVDFSDPGSVNSGIFIYHPELINWPKSTLVPDSLPVPVAASAIPAASGAPVHDDVPKK